MEAVIDVHPLGLPRRLPLLPAGPEVPHQLLLFGVHGDDREVHRLARGRLVRDVLELGIAIRMAGQPLQRLPGGLEAIAFGMEDVHHGGGTDAMPLIP